MRISSKGNNLPELRINQLLASIFTSGPSYHYIVDFSDRSLVYTSNNIGDILGIRKDVLTFDDIIGIIHPKDIAYVAAAEEAVLIQCSQQHTISKTALFKSAYCFRAKTADGSYRLFQHQAVTLTTDDKGKVKLVLNVHTDISLLTQKNNFTVTLSDLLGKRNLWKKKITIPSPLKSEKASFSERELEIIMLISKGYKNPEIAEQLFISPHTVMTHRRNILRKAGVTNSAGLISYCMANHIL